MARQTITDHPREETGTSPSGRAMLESKIRHARIVMLAEQIWPRLWLPGAVIMVFAVVSSFGLWPALPRFLHLLLLALFGLALLASLVPLFRLRQPDRHAAIRWLEKKSGLPHRPATIVNDRLVDRADEKARALWKVHRQRALRHLKAMKAGLPRPDTARFDPYALRFPLVLALAAVLGLRADSLRTGLEDAFRFVAPASLNDLRIDAWITPPAYTGRPPVMLVDGGRDLAGQLEKFAARTGTNETGMLKVPEMSELTIRVSGADAAKLQLTFDQAPTSKKTPPPPESRPSAKTKITEKKEGNVRDLRAVLKRATRATLTLKGHPIGSWRFAITPDHPPAIAFVKKPGASPRGALHLAYRIADDYGVVQASARIRTDLRHLANGRRPAPGRTLPSSPAPDNLVPPLGTPPEFALQLPKGNVKRGTASTYKDLTAHPWAGLNVELVLVARDEAGKTGQSTIARLRLPERKFTKPLARSVIAQRRILSETPFRYRQVTKALDEITRQAVNSKNPDLSSGVYLGLRSVYWRLLQASRRATIRSAVDQMWEIALTIEDGNLSKAERALRSAQDKLMDALAKNAPPEEIARLTKELRQALDRFLQAMAKNRQTRPQDAQNRQNPGNQRTLTSRELDKMLRDIENLARTGARDAARRMLGQLREMLENLNTGQSKPSARGQKMRQQLDELGKMIMEQRRLLDETRRPAAPRHRGRNGQRRGQRQEGRPVPGQRPATGRQQGNNSQQGQGQRQGQSPDGWPNGKGEGMGRQGQGAGDHKQRAGAESLRQRQGKLLDGLNDLMDQMGRMGMKVPRDLMRAGSNMGRAEQQLQHGQMNPAGRQQAQALENLRKGAGKLAEQMMRSGPGNRTGRNRDPLGRAMRSNGPEFGDDVKVPREIDTRRARDILEELRRRLGQNTRPPAELDYLERLIEQF